MCWLLRRRVRGRCLCRRRSPCRITLSFWDERQLWRWRLLPLIRSRRRVRYRRYCDWAEANGRGSMLRRPGPASAQQVRASTSGAIGSGSGGARTPFNSDHGLLHLLPIGALGRSDDKPKCVQHVAHLREAGQCSLAHTPLCDAQTPQAHCRVSAPSGDSVSAPRRTTGVVSVAAHGASSSTLG